MATKRVYNIHAGHAKVGGGAIGAVGYLNESVENRYICKRVIKHLRDKGHTVYNCTVDRGTQSSILAGINKKQNAHKSYLDISIHFNSGANQKKSDGKTTGTEVFVYSANSKAYSDAKKVCEALTKLGFKNRGVKTNANLSVLKRSKNPAMLIEVCFVDDPDDAQLYKKKKKKIAKAIADAIS